ncbi:Serine/Threonine protein kinase and Signal Transduction Histidine Kinase (STHK) with GAF sensor [Trichormus variabilis ATCC 29413]|uniref:histidine kinase n=4 Tax=Anabaena variabilis TaxID=264691 RepID=Q3MBN4_TRIV2|nr:MULTISPECIES: ATP-binding sensor histidine kinase [Nostocaceae]ABA21602.1 Serine/Threonine protein kinase and Signal Transduction Histidine Kinase (STHK) with GAF sensor [Trichormus variabilis ATCC 29413]MBC1255157.1 AAA family ATPase [Trichormus variabilis V5]MBC1266201.1 AAA family ATPase [Trichormus variabilis FSR]MBC1301654.1 AAA family ATPase [Trichormus variabilis N2B]MBC1311517.1 AAA family ATPase [Trichormus variabilis PNB]
MIVLSDPIFPLSGYRITEQLYFGSKTIVYRGLRKQDQKPVVIKLMRNEYPTFQEIAQFRNQYTITKDLDIPGIVKPLSLETYRNSYALVMEDFGGLSLKDWGQISKDSNEYGTVLKRFFHIAIAIASTLESLHRSRIIHKDIKPANILINPTTLEIRVTDFSIATLLPREVQVLTNHNVLEGTLAYLSPEQTGRMNRGIDYRSDFYSLGVTFFELLTGQLPFMTIEPMELVYCHIAKQPPKASDINPKIPTILSDIVSKLMAKNAEDRYQSAYGLAYDLEICHKQWQETGNITSFELATKDVSDRFLIPEKLYGRQHEVATLLAAFERATQGTTEMILVTGFSGIGKTAVVNEVHKPIVRQQSYFIKGKFDQFQRDIPLSGLVQAFRDLIGQILLETDAQIQRWRSKILSALGEQAQVIIDVIPELAEVIGQQSEVSELSGSSAQNRFNLLFQRFIQVFSSKHHPLVIFLDDLQWADTASLKFIQLLMNQTNLLNKNPAAPPVETKENLWIPVFNGEPWTGSELQRNNEEEHSLFLIGAYRDNEVSQAHPLSLTIKEIEKVRGNITRISLSPLNQTNLNALISDTLRCQEEITIPLSQMVFVKTQGNPFFATQFIKSLHQDGVIKFNFDVAYWQYDIAKIQELSLTDDVVEFMGQQIEKLPTTTQNILKLAACIGNEFDLKTLAIAHEKSVSGTASDLWAALHEGIILPQTELYKFFQEDNNSVAIFGNKKPYKSRINHCRQVPTYKFIHDRVQQAAYSLIPEQLRKQIHLKIGLLLLDKIPVAEREDKVFQLVNQLNVAVELITHQSKRDELAQMNLIAGRKALASTAYTAAIKYLTTGIELLAGDSWENQYQLTLALYETAAEAAYLAGNFERMESLIQVVLLQAKTLLEQVKIYEIKIQAYGAQNQAIEAVNTALTFLKLLGVEFPENPSQSDFQLAMAGITTNLNGKLIENLINLPEMRDKKSLAAIQILSSASGLVYQAVPQLFPLIVLKQVELSLKDGNAHLSAYAYVLYGLMLCGIIGDIESGYQFGKLALRLTDKFNSEELKAKITEIFYATISHWKEHTKEILSPLLEGYSAALQTGDLEFASYCLYTHSYASYFIGTELTGLASEMASYSHAISQIKQERVFNWHAIYRQTVLNLIQANENPCDLIGEAYNEKIMRHVHQISNDGTGLVYLHFNKLFLCYVFGEFKQAIKNSYIAENYLESGVGNHVFSLFYFYDSLARLAVYNNLIESEKKEVLDKVQANQNKIQHWVKYAPMNYLHKFYLVEAEQYRVKEKYLEAIDYYDRSIYLAKENEYINEEALANELAARFYLQWGKEKIAQTYLTDAYYGYSRWGAKAKVDDLAKHYPQLLAPILQQEKLTLQASDRITSATYQSIPDRSIQQTVIGSKTSISDSLDLASVIKASQALSGEIELEQLLSTLMQVVMENAGASKSALILTASDTSELVVTTVSHSTNSASVFTSFPANILDSSFELPVSLIKYVKRNGEIFVIDNAKTVDFLASDRYILREQPKSLLCIPIINQGKLLGILYLENNLTTGAFTRDRVEVLKLLTTQAAISIENAMLYKNLAQANQNLEDYNHRLEEKVEARTQELNDKNHCLQQTLQELQRTQTQLIQSEKMSSLGQMIAGIAHEINNPINFIHGNIAHASEYVQDLLNLVTIYQRECPNYSDILAEEYAQIDIDFLAEDLPKILNSMRVGSSRIRNIVLSLRNFSRLDESDMKPVDIHEGIDNTLMILHHRLKENSERPEITLIKEYAQLPLVNCYAGQLNQVFMNIISNAIDALEESVVSRQLSIGKTNDMDNMTTAHPTIRICTELLGSTTLRIRIADNGFGMTEAVQQKIFDPFYTTKPVGSGTGLGLSISYQVVVEKHKGQLTCYSALGQGTEFVIEIPI